MSTTLSAKKLLQPSSGAFNREHNLEMQKVSIVTDIRMKDAEPTREGYPLSYELLSFSEALWKHCGNSKNKNYFMLAASRTEEGKKKGCCSLISVSDTQREKRGGSVRRPRRAAA